jgi:protein TonB
VVEHLRRVSAEFIVPPPKKEPQKKRVEKKAPKPVDLTEKPQLAAKEDDIQKKRPNKPTVRRVYGVRRVHATGLGSGGTLREAVIGKQGNTLNKDVDTITATQSDIKGEVVSVTTITRNPKYLSKPRPQYTQQMRENNIEGVIKVKVLVDTDGRVKKAVALNDLGFGSKDAAITACLNATFEPAQREGEAVAVWIIIPVRFVLLG